jgi:hypothetical protein
MVGAEEGIGRVYDMHGQSTDTQIVRSSNEEYQSNINFIMPHTNRESFSP